MSHLKFFHKDESGQTALEAAIILIAFVVVASVFAFTILSAGSSSTEKSEAAIYSGLENVQSSMAVKGAVVATGESDKVTAIKFTVALASGSDPVDLTDTTAAGANDTAVVIAYRDARVSIASIPWEAEFIGDADSDNMLEAGELGELTITMADVKAGDPLAAIVAPGANEEFTLEVKPPSGAVLNITRSTPASIEAVMELR